MILTIDIGNSNIMFGGFEADEPSFVARISTDPAATEDIYELVSELNENHGVTVIMITHDIGAAIKYSDKILYMGKEPRFFGSAEEYISSPVFPTQREAKND
jgi:ABC-type Mn2+/Zn2+ transport system ATPase subunit